MDNAQNHAIKMVQCISSSKMIFLLTKSMVNCKNFHYDAMVRVISYFTL